MKLQRDFVDTLYFVSLPFSLRFRKCLANSTANVKNRRLWVDFPRLQPKGILSFPRRLAIRVFYNTLFTIVVAKSDGWEPLDAAISRFRIFIILVRWPAEDSDICCGLVVQLRRHLSSNEQRYVVTLVFV